MIFNFEHLRDGDALVPEEGELLYALIRATKPMRCVETGTHKGLSTHYIAQALQDNGVGHVHTCDPVDWGQFKIFEASPLKERISFHPIKGTQMIFDEPHKIDFLFIDGYHGKKDVIEEIEHLFPMLAPNAIVIFHDCDNEPISNSEMVNAAIFEKGLKTVYIPTKNRMRIYEHSGF
jgi:predicted O-methyltransferase YrrM